MGASLDEQLVLGQCRQAVKGNTYNFIMGQSTVSEKMGNSATNLDAQQKYRKRGELWLDRLLQKGKFALGTGHL